MIETSISSLRASYPSSTLERTGETRFVDPVRYFPGRRKSAGILFILPWKIGLV